MAGTELTAGANRALPTGTLTLRVPGPFDISLLVTGDEGRVRGDADFVFFNQTTAPGVTLRDATTAAVDLPRLRPGATRVTVVLSPADPSRRLGNLPTPTLTVAAGSGDAVRFTPPPVTSETVLLMAELYLRNGVWKVRALGQGYADGLAGIARDFGVDVTEDTDSPTVLPGPAGGRGPGGGSGGFVPSAPGTPAVPGNVSVPGNPSAPGNPFAPGAGAFGSPAVPSEPGPGRGPSASVPSRWAAAPPVPAMPAAPPSLAAWRTEVIVLTNAARAREGLGPLTDEPRLTAAAQSHSDDMAGRNYFDHTGLDGRQPADRVTAAGYTYRRCAENIAAGQTTPAAVVDGWMNSPGHRANILTPDLTQIGIGIAHGGTYGIYWTQVFGTPMPTANPFAP